MRIYYWNVRKNFGDLLSSLIIDRWVHMPHQWAPPEKAELIMVGSILEHMPVGWSGVIAGSGKLHEKTKLELGNARVLALRGPLTARGVKGDYAIGDMGLMADELVPVEDKKYDLGIVPHWTDKSLEHSAIFKKYNPRIIHPEGHPLDVIAEIGRCKKIVSSSLHGIIVADALSIPRRIEIAPRMLTHPHQEGGVFKWHDYSASVGMKLEIGKTQEVDRNKIIEKQHELFDVLMEIKSIFS